MAMVDGKSLLKLSNSNCLQRFIHESIDDMIGRKQTSSAPYGGDLEWTPGEAQKARSLIQNVYKQMIVDEESFPNISDLSESDVKVIKECFAIRKEEICQSVAKERYLAMGQPLVENIDWKLKWMIGSSQVPCFSEPLLQVDLRCTDKDKKENNINFEMNLEYVDLLIKDLESAKSNFQL
ncbi:PREDICTED: uncharacterized protein LOC108566780 [Nicrophorus vespilloides]|uniref:Uncharacterized protein LOC108566780 n=1 Tax=Nicrophorus vespilloides TaxID=110193 RepID=A0ABM1N661_NICVS|nr:PREDICTED: uncharacterized protein LOC108566780 [Nicrophorus vespilloides]